MVGCGVGAGLVGGRGPMAVLVRILLAMVFALAGGAGTYEYELVGNGFCVDASGRRLKLGPSPRTHGTDLAWVSASVAADGHSQRCEQICSRVDDCVGYMTEDHKQCTVITLPRYTDLL